MRSFTQFPTDLGTVYITQEDGFITRISFLPPASELPRCDHDPVLQLAVRWLRDYFAGNAPDPNILPIRLQGTPFQLSVWEILKTIPYGKTVTYGEIAKKLGRKMSPQAIGGAVGRNPIIIVVPCHRVIGADGSLTGFSEGLHLKEYLLNLENALT